MMYDQRLLRASALLFLLGLAAIFLANVMAEVPDVPVAALSTDYIGKSVRTTGEVTDVAKHGGHLFFTLQGQNASVRVVQFDSQQSLTPNQSVMVTGTVDIYKGSLEIVAKRIMPAADLQTGA